MRKHLPWIAILLIGFSALVFQWLRTDAERSRIAVKTDALEKELAQMKHHRANISAFEEKIPETDKLFAILEKRLPPVPQEETFRKELVARFKKQNLALTFSGSSAADKEFHKEIRLTFTYSPQELASYLLTEIFMDVERLVHWELNKQEHVIVTTIYSSLLNKDMPGLKPCMSTGDEPMNYVPFNSLVREDRKRLDATCSKRNMNKDVLIKIKQFENRRKQQSMLEEIVFQLEQH